MLFDYGTGRTIRMLQHPEGEWIDETKAASILPIQRSFRFCRQTHCSLTAEHAAAPFRCVTAPYPLCFYDDLCARCLFQVSRFTMFSLVEWIVKSVLSAAWILSIEKMPREREKCQIAVVRSCSKACPLRNHHYGGVKNFTQFELNCSECESTDCGYAMNGTYAQHQNAALNQ